MLGGVLQNIYLDNAATTYPKPDIVYETMDKLYREIGVNIGRGGYEKARKAYEIYVETKDIIKNLVGSNGEVIFTSSATNAFNKLIYGLQIKKNSNVYITPFEHNAVVRPLNYYAQKNEINIKLIPYKDNYEIDWKKLQHMASIEKPDYLFVNHISNVTGFINNPTEIIDFLSEYNPISIVDGAQSVGLLDINMIKDGYDYLVFAGHKTLYGPFGIAGIITQTKKRSIDINPLMHGGNGSDSLNTQVFNEHEVGSPNIMANFGLNSSIKWLKDIGIDKIREKKFHLTQYTISELKNIYGLKVYELDNKANQLGIISFTHSEYQADVLAQILDQDFKISVRSGYHCAPYIHDLLNTKSSGGTVRVSLGYFNNKDEIDRLIDSLKKL
jgi:cysteine desulfurase family protein